MEPNCLFLFILDKAEGLTLEEVLLNTQKCNQCTTAEICVAVGIFS